MKKTIWVLGFVFIAVNSQAAVYSAYEKPYQPMSTTRMTQDKMKQQYMTRKRAYTQSGNRVFHCVRDGVCYRVDPENMLLYKNNFVRTQAKDSVQSWYAMQPAYMRTKNRQQIKWQEKPKMYSKIVIKQKDIWFKKGRFEKSRYPGTYYSKLNPPKP